MKTTLILRSFGLNYNKRAEYYDVFMGEEYIIVRKTQIPTPYEKLDIKKLHFLSFLILFTQQLIYFH